MHQHLSTSAQQARALLGAWQSQDSSILHRELDRIQHLAAFCGDAAEMERLDLLSEIASELGAAHSDASDVCCSLLEHLAFSMQHRNPVSHLVH